MVREHMKGAADRARATLRRVPARCPTRSFQSKGKLDSAKGGVHNAVGNVEDAARDLTKG
jgi:hypothetical protein